MDNQKFEKEKAKFLYRMNKNSVDKEIYVLLKPRTDWETGLTLLRLKNEVCKIRKKRACDLTIRSAISRINKYGKEYGIYIKSDFGWVQEEDNKRREFRYFVPKNERDREREHNKLQGQVAISLLKEKNLTHFETVTIPHEKELELLRDEN